MPPDSALGRPRRFGQHRERQPVGREPVEHRYGPAEQLLLLPADQPGDVPSAASSARHGQIPRLGSVSGAARCGQRRVPGGRLRGSLRGPVPDRPTDPGEQRQQAFAAVPAQPGVELVQCERQPAVPGGRCRPVSPITTWRSASVGSVSPILAQITPGALETPAGGREQAVPA